MDQDIPLSTIILHRDQIGHLLTILGGPTGSLLSPLNREQFPAGGVTDNKLLLEEGLLDAQGELSEPWDQAFRYLLRPTLEVVAAIGFLDGRKALCGYGPCRKTDGLIGFTPLKDTEYQLVYPLSKDHFLSLLVAGLGLDVETLALDIEADMTLETLLALAGMIDAGREARMESMLARMSAPLPEIHFERILYNTRKGLVSNDYRWLASAIRNVFPFEFKVTQKTLLEGLSDLQELGWVENRAEELWSFTETFDVSRMHLESPLNFGILSIHHQDQSGAEGIQVGILRTMATLWSLDYQNKTPGKPLVRISTVSGPNLAQALQHLLEVCLEKPPSTQAEIVSHQSLSPKVDNSLCPKCHTSGQPGDRFCGTCGAAKE